MPGETPCLSPCATELDRLQCFSAHQSCFSAITCFSAQKCFSANDQVDVEVHERFLKRFLSGTWRFFGIDLEVPATVPDSAWPESAGALPDSSLVKSKSCSFSASRRKATLLQIYKNMFQNTSMSKVPKKSNDYVPLCLQIFCFYITVLLERQWCFSATCETMYAFQHGACFSASSIITNWNTKILLYTGTLQKYLGSSGFHCVSTTSNSCRV